MKSPKSKTLSDFCIFRDSPQKVKDSLGDGEDLNFVGLKYEGGKDGNGLQICFPLGFKRCSKSAELHKSIFTLLKVLGDGNLTRNAQGSICHDSDFLVEQEFPLQAYINVLRFFLDHGYFMETEVVYSRGKSGKVNWSRTIKLTKPIVSEDESGRCSTVYLDLVTRKTNHQDDLLITQIHKFCVYDGVQKIGPLFGLFDAEKSGFETDDFANLYYKLFSQTLQQKIANTFNDSHLNLFNSMLQIVNYLGDQKIKDNDKARDFKFGVNKFAPLWENMVESIFGNKNREDFYPKCVWHVKNAPSLEMRPDTVMEHDGDLFILDSKFYKYGVAGFGLPQSDSVTKQMAYAEYAQEKINRKDRGCENLKKVYNVFVMPYCGSVDAGLKRPFAMKYAGYATSDWKKDGDEELEKFPYHRIIAILMDVKTVMENYAANASAQKSLAEMARESILNPPHSKFSEHLRWNI